jgi:hypothetical protein
MTGSVAAATDNQPCHARFSKLQTREKSDMVSIKIRYNQITTENHANTLFQEYGEKHCNSGNSVSLC